MGDIMHNLISYNQLAGWKQSVERLTHTLNRSIEESDLLNDYYSCLIAVSYTHLTLPTTPYV